MSFRPNAFVVAAIVALASPVAVVAQHPAGSAPPAVLFHPAEMRAVAAQYEFIGRAVAVDKVDIRARVQGFLGPRKFADGEPVKEGQVLFTIERDSYEAAVAQKTAARESAAAALVNADIQLKRASELLRTQAGTQATFDLRTAEELQAKAALAEAEAALADARIKLSYCEIRSPINGRISKAAVSPGNMVDANTGILVTVVSEQPMRVQFSITQRQLLEARKASGGLPQDTPSFDVRVRLADGSLLEEKGKLDFLDVQVDPRTDTLAARAVFANANRILTDSQSLRVVLEATNVPKVLVAPQAAIAIDQSGSYVFVVGEANKVEQRRIRVGARRDGMATIEEGLKEGDRVIVQGQQRVRPGMVVAAQLAPPAPHRAN